MSVPTTLSLVVHSGLKGVRQIEDLGEETDICLQWALLLEPDLTLSSQGRLVLVVEDLDKVGLVDVVLVGTHAVVIPTTTNLCPLAW